MKQCNGLHNLLLTMGGANIPVVLAVARASVLDGLRKYGLFYLLS
jgi:energy-converting hydrogenase Eha subunit H